MPRREPDAREAEWGVMPARHTQQPASGPTTSEVGDLVTRAIAAKGGVEKLRTIRTIISSADMTIDSAAGRSSVPATTSIQYPDRFRTDAMMPAGRLVQVFNKGECWVQNAQGVKDASAALAASLRAHVHRDVVLLLLGLADGRVTARRVADVVEGGRAMPALEVRSADVPAVTLVLDPESSLILRQRYAPAGDPWIVEESFSDYRDVNGVKVAFKTVVRGAGVPTVERVVRSFRYNVPVDPALFTRPS